MINFQRIFKSALQLTNKQLNINKYTSRYAFTVIRKYTIEHEWLEYDDKTLSSKLGITDYAQKALGDIVHIEFPQVGQSFNLGDSIGSVESVKMAADVYTPVTGEIQEVNESVLNDISLVNQDAEKNWIVKIKLNNLKEVEKLMTKQEYQEHIKKPAGSSH